MPRPPKAKSAATLSSLAREGLPLLAGLFLKFEGFQLAIASKVRVAFHLKTQAEAFQLMRFGREFAAQLSDLEQSVVFGSTDILDIPIDVNPYDPFDRGERFNYMMRVQFGKEWRSFSFQSNELVSWADLRMEAMERFAGFMQNYPEIAAHLNEFGQDAFNLKLNSLTRRS